MNNDLYLQRLTEIRYKRKLRKIQDSRPENQIECYTCGEVKPKRKFFSYSLNKLKGICQCCASDKGLQGPQETEYGVKFSPQV